MVEIIELKNKLNFRKEENHLIGKVNDFDIILSQHDTYINIRISSNNVEYNDKIKNFLDNCIEKNSITSYRRKAFGTDLEVKNDLILDSQSIVETIESYSSFLKSLDILNTCFTCLNERKTSFIKYNNLIINSCDQCITETEEKIYKLQNQPNNYLKGFIGAVIGALIGSIVWILVGYIGFVASLAGIAIAAAASKGYDILGGKQSKIKAIILMISVFIGVFWGEYIGVMIASFQLDSTWTISMWFKETPYLLFEENLLYDMMSSILIGLLFAGLGTYRMIKNTFLEKEIITQIERL